MRCSVSKAWLGKRGDAEAQRSHDSTLRSGDYQRISEIAPNAGYSCKIKQGKHLRPQQKLTTFSDGIDGQCAADAVYCAPQLPGRLPRGRSTGLAIAITTKRSGTRPESFGCAEETSYESPPRIFIDSFFTLSRSISHSLTCADFRHNCIRATAAGSLWRNGEGFERQSSDGSSWYYVCSLFRAKRRRGPLAGDAERDCRWQWPLHGSAGFDETRRAAG